MSFIQTERQSFLNEQMKTKSQNQLELIDMIKIKDGPHKKNIRKKKPSEKIAPKKIQKMKQQQIQESLQKNSFLFHTLHSNVASSKTN